MAELPRSMQPNKKVFVSVVLLLLALLSLTGGCQGLDPQPRGSEGEARYLEAANFEHEALQSVDLFLAILMRIVSFSVAVALGIPVLVSAISNGLF